MVRLASGSSTTNATADASGVHGRGRVRLPPPFLPDAYTMAPPLHIAIVSCTRKHVHELGPNLLSLATHAPTAHVHVFADDPGREALSGCLTHFRAAFKSFTLYSVDELSSRRADALVDYDPSRARSSPRLQPNKFACASAKLMLQSAPPLRHLSYILALDVDTVTNEDIEPALWRWTAQMRSHSTLWGLVPEHEEVAPLTFGTELRDVRPPELRTGEYYESRRWD